MLAAMPAWAAEQPASYTLQVSTQAVLAIAKGLQELPYKDAAPVLTEIQRQVDEQIKAAKPAEPPK